MMNYNADVLKKMNRKTLQLLAKHLKIPANIKSEIIIRRISKLPKDNIINNPIIKNLFANDLNNSTDEIDEFDDRRKFKPNANSTFYDKNTNLAANNELFNFHDEPINKISNNNYSNTKKLPVSTKCSNYMTITKKQQHGSIRNPICPNTITTQINKSIKETRSKPSRLNVNYDYLKKNYANCSVEKSAPKNTVNVKISQKTYTTNNNALQTRNVKETKTSILRREAIAKKYSFVK